MKNNEQKGKLIQKGNSVGNAERIAKKLTEKDIEINQHQTQKQKREKGRCLLYDVELQIGKEFAVCRFLIME